MATIDLSSILTRHRIWLTDHTTGQRANLRDAYLSGAHLRGAYLSGAHLSGANLSGADLRDANLRDTRWDDQTILDTGETFAIYRSETLPQLFAASERGIEAIRGWGGHQWSDCPMRLAFQISSEDQAPALLRPRIRQFVQLYDAGLLTPPAITAQETISGNE